MIDQKENRIISGNQIFLLSHACLNKNIHNYLYIYTVKIKKIPATHSQANNSCGHKMHPSITSRRQGTPAVETWHSDRKDTRLMLLSSPLVYNIAPSGDRVIVLTPPVCPSRTETISACCHSHMRYPLRIPL